jgi:hypothetical protein
VVTHRLPRQNGDLVEQWRLQRPQFSGSIEKSLQKAPVVAQRRVRHARHLPPMQRWFLAHCRSHAPQCRGSPVRSRHDDVPQSAWPAAHDRQVPPTQKGVFPPQRLAHRPQLSGSDASVLQPPRQRVLPAGHDAWVQAPPLHVAPLPHACAQAPQFVGLDARSTHRPAQHVRPAPHATPHAPHAVSSDETSRHVPSQQACPAAHVRPQPPQFAASAVVATQTLLQQAVPKRVPQPPVQAPPVTIPAPPTTRASTSAATNAKSPTVGRPGITGVFRSSVPTRAPWATAL